MERQLELGTVDERVVNIGSAFIHFTLILGSNFARCGFLMEFTEYLHQSRWTKAWFTIGFQLRKY
jgi:hypothetical protein